MKLKQICVDMDGVLVDFVTAACSTHGRDPITATEFDFHKTWGITAAEFWEPIDAAGADWWANLRPYPWTEDLLELLSFIASTNGAELIVATTPSRCAYSTAGKVASIHKLFGNDFRSYCITPRKWLLGRCGAILIDDNDLNCQKFHQHGGNSIVFPQSWSSAGAATDPVLFVSNAIASLLEDQS